MNKKDRLEINVEELRLEKDSITRRYNLILLLYITAFSCLFVIWQTFHNNILNVQIQIIYFIWVAFILALFTLITFIYFIFNKIIRLNEIDREIIDNLKKIKSQRGFS